MIITQTGDAETRSIRVVYTFDMFSDDLQATPFPHKNVSVGDNIEDLDDICQPVSTSLSLQTVDSIVQSKVSANIRALNSFMQDSSLVAEKGDAKINIINVAERRCYKLPNSLYNQFFTLLEACRLEQRMLHFAERQETAERAKSGIMIDFDYYQTTETVQIQPRHFEALATKIAKWLKEAIDFTSYAQDDRFSFKMFIIRKPKIIPQQHNGKMMFKDGFHLLIPEIQITKGLKKHMLADLLKKKLIQTVFRGFEFAEEPETMLDKMSASVMVHFIGHSKPGKPAYPLTHAYNVSVDLIDDEVEKTLIDPSDYQKYNLSYELSLVHYTNKLNDQPTWLVKREYNYRPELETIIQICLEKTNKGILDIDDILESDASVDILTLGNAEAAHIKKLLEILTIDYATEYEKWFKVICAIGHCSPQYKPLAIWFSHRKPESYSPAEIDRVWGEALRGRESSQKPVTKRSLIYWARTSSPLRFNEIDRENYAQIMARLCLENEGRMEHAMVAKVLHSMIADKFVVDVADSINGSKRDYYWYEFATPGQQMETGQVYKWRQEFAPDNIHKFLIEHMPKVFDNQISLIKDRAEKTAKEGEAKYWARVGKVLGDYKSRLGNDSFQNGVIKQARYMFRQRGFANELDSYVDIIGVGNGILRVGARPKLIRGFHEYKISKYTTTDYIPYDPNNQCVKDIIQMVRDIFPEPDVSEFMLFHAATGLDSKDSACMLMLLCGGGQNGKTTLAKLVHKTLGDMYASSGKPQLLTDRNEKANEANSALMQMVGKQYFYFDEFNAKDEFNMARVKSIVNPGVQTGRDLYKTASNFRNTCNPICMSNFEFIITTTDHGSWRRIRYYRNKVKFCSNPDPNNKYEKPVNSKIIDEWPNTDEYKQAMLSILVHYYQRLCEEYGGDIKNVPCNTILRETEVFRNSQDALNRFLTEMIVKSPNATPIALQTIAGKYQDWYSKVISKQNNISIKDIVGELENSRIANFLQHKYNMKMLVGYRVRNSMEEELGIDETPLSQWTQSQMEPDQPTIITPAIASDNVGDISGMDLTDLTLFEKNQPLHIQSSEVIPIDFDISLDELDL